MVSFLSSNHFIPGFVQTKASTWQLITSDKFILDIVKHGLKVPFLTQGPSLTEAPHSITPMSHAQKVILSAEINNLLCRGIVVQSHPQPGMIISPTFTTAKKDGSHRFILNLKAFNTFVEHFHFKMESLSDVLRIIQPGVWMASVDLKDAYYSIPIHRDDQKYFTFLWEGRLYRFVCMPNGYTDGPRVFTKVLKAPFGTLRSQGNESVIYLDDGYLQGITYDLCLSNIHDTISLLKSLGFFISEKSVLHPTQELTYLGFILNSKSMTITFTDKRKEKIWLLTCSMLDNPIQCFRKVAGLIGMIIAALPGVMYGQMHYRRLNLALSIRKGNYNKNMTLSCKALKDIKWWQLHVHNATSLFFHPPESFQIHFY